MLTGEPARDRLRREQRENRTYTLGELTHADVEALTAVVEDLKTLVQQLYTYYGLRVESWPDGRPIVLFDGSSSQAAMSQWENNRDWLRPRGFTREGWFERSELEREQIIGAWIYTITHPHPRVLRQESEG
jgi:hypothetical protein